MIGRGARYPISHKTDGPGDQREDNPMKSHGSLAAIFPLTSRPQPLVRLLASGFSRSASSRPSLSEIITTPPANEHITLAS